MTMTTEKEKISRRANPLVIKGEYEMGKNEKVEMKGSGDNKKERSPKDREGEGEGGK